jgi:hypothetical protein
MFKSVDLKSLLMGGLLVLAVLCIVGATPNLMPSAPCGRFTMVISNLPGGDAFILDTVTGQAWSRNTLYGDFTEPKLVSVKQKDPNEPRAK